MIDAATALAQGWQHHQAGNLSQAEVLYRQALLTEPQSLNALFLLGWVCHAQGRLEEGIGLYQQVLQVKPDCGEVLNNLGVAHASQGRNREALACFQDAVRCKPDHAEAFNNLGFLLASQGDLNQALTAYQRALALQPNYPEAWNHLGIAHYMQNRPEEAVRCFQQALALRPEFPDALNNLGNALAALDKLAEAADCYRRALRLQPNSPLALNGLGVVHAKLLQYDEAVACWQRCLALNANDPQTYRNLGNAYCSQGKNDQALLCYQRVLALSPDNAEARLMVAALSGAAIPTRLPADYVTNLFDWYAPTFDQVLLERLKHCGPELLKTALEPAPPPRSLDVLDLGCGTGLCGRQFRDWANTLIGVDLSAKMLEKARERGIYDKLIQGELLAALQGRAGQFDLVLATDVFVYLGDLEPLVRAVHRALRPGGRFAFTVELLEGDGYRLVPAVGFRHSRAYLRELATRVQLQEVCMNQAVIRTENGQDTVGLVVVLVRH